MIPQGGQLSNALQTAVDHHRAGRLREAEALYRQVLKSQGRHVEALQLSGLAAHQLGRHEVAVERLSTAIRLEPANPVVHLNLGEAYRALKRADKAQACYERALELKPDYPEAHNNLGLLFQKQGRLEEAHTHYERALSLQPRLPEAINNLAGLLMECGLPAESIGWYRRAVELRPDDCGFHDHLIFALHFQPDLDRAVVEREFQLWNQRHANIRTADLAPHRNDPSPGRRLRVGYVSPDFRHHPVSFFLYPLLRAHDPGQVEVWAYSGVKKPGAVTEGMKKLAACWRETSAWSDADLAAQIRADGIDILVDLAMHAEGSRLRTFARRPAPVQVSWLAYPGTTGLPAIDYRLTDRRIDPPEGRSDLPGGAPACLPDAWCCYHPLYETPAVSDLPALRAGSGAAVTFGCLNNFTKVNDAVLMRWARLFSALPDSRLVLHCPDAPSVRQRVCGTLAREGGVSEGRIEFVPKQSRLAYLQTYSRIDIGLDPFPYGGMTTTCEALWMGVPVLTFPGETPGSRVGASLLAAVGLDELIALSEAEYVEVAAALARDLPRLEQLRKTLRARMERSPLMDAPRFARHVEQMYRQMWMRWCRQGTPPGTGAF